MTPGTPTGQRSASRTTARRGFVAVWWRQHQQCLIVLLICSITVGVAWHRSARDAVSRHEQNLDRAASAITQDIHGRFVQYGRILQIARALFDASDDVTRDDWRIFCEGINLEENAPGLHALAYVAKVEKPDLAHFVHSARAAGSPDFRVRSHRFADRETDGEPSYVVRYSEPESRNVGSLGVDLATYSVNKAVYDSAAHDGVIRMTAGISLAQVDAQREGLVAALPLLRHNESPQRHFGWVAIVVVLDDFFASARTTEWDGFLLDVRLEQGARTYAIHSVRPGEHGTEASKARPELARERSTEVFGQTLRLVAVPANDNLIRPDMTEANIVLLVGGMATALITTMAWSATRTRHRALAIARQMTESLRMSEQRQRELADRADTANRAKSEFLANMSHEIRTPMTAILGYADLLEGPDPDPAAGQEAIRAIRRSGRHLLTIINDVLDLSKIESGRLEVVEDLCDLCSLVEDVTGSLRSQAERKGLGLTARIVNTVPDRVLTDTHRVRQILINLVGNAIKFTEQGGVELAVSYRLGRLQIEVRDTGIGVAADKLDAIFRPFEQADNSASRRHEGTGLGLTISRRLAQLLGGDIRARSALGQGSVFTLEIATTPAPGASSIREFRHAPPANKPATAGAVATLRGRVLLAEDGPDNQKLITFILRRAGLEVDVVSNGREAVDRIEAGEQYDLLVSDMQMPEMDGYAATEHLRANGHTLPILALTAHAMEGDRERCLQAGCDDYETKPIDRASLLAKIERMMSQAERSTLSRVA